MQRCLILYNLALVNRYEPGGTLDECCRLADKDRILKINSHVTRTLVKIQREDWSAGFYKTLLEIALTFFKQLGHAISWLTAKVCVSTQMTSV